MSLLDDYNNLKEMLLEASNPTNITQVEIFKLVYQKFLEEGDHVSELLHGYMYAPEALRGFTKDYKKDKQEILKKLLDYGETK